MTTSTPRKLKPSVAIIGPGRLGLALALALSKSGYPIKAFVARQRVKAEKAAVTVAPKRRIQILDTKQLADLTPVDLLVITTPDDVIENLANRLAVMENRKVRGRTVLHTSGALSSAILAPLAEVGFHTGSLHPLISVSDSRAGAQAFPGAFFCIEGDRAAGKMARKIVRDLKGRSLSIQPESKALYHAAALTAAGQVTALLDIAIDLLVLSGLNRRVAQQVLMPLLESTVTNLKVSTPQKALTGTFARGDFAIVQRHLAALSEIENSQALKIYKLLGLRSLDLASKNGMNSELFKRIEQLLKSQES